MPGIIQGCLTNFNSYVIAPDNLQNDGELNYSFLIEITSTINLFFRCSCVEPDNPSNTTLQYWQSKNMSSFAIPWTNLTVTVSMPPNPIVNSIKVYLWNIPGQYTEANGRLISPVCKLLTVLKLYSFIQYRSLLATQLSIQDD